MITTVIWEEADVQVGRWFFKPGDSKGQWNDPKHFGYYVSTAHMLAYHASAGNAEKISMVSLADGMITKAKTASAMADDLNRGGYVPLPSALLIKLLDHHRQRNEPNAIT